MRLHPQLHDEHWELADEDRGSGVPDYAIERVFERFYSLALPQTGQRGSGFGLPFVGEVARLHGGDVTPGNRDGGGAMAMLPPANWLSGRAGALQRVALPEATLAHPRLRHAPKHMPQPLS